MDGAAGAKAIRAGAAGQHSWPFLLRYHPAFSSRARSLDRLGGRLALGSDYPYDMVMQDCVQHVRSLSISEADKDLFRGHGEDLLSGARA
jgi:hypothetical protein